MDSKDAPNIPLRALRANDTEATIAAIIRLFRDPDLRQTLAANARHYIEAQFTWSRAGEAYCQVLEGKEAIRDSRASVNSTNAIG